MPYLGLGRTHRRSTGNMIVANPIHPSFTMPFLHCTTHSSKDISTNSSVFLLHKRKPTSCPADGLSFLEALAAPLQAYLFSMKLAEPSRQSKCPDQSTGMVTTVKGLVLGSGTRDTIHGNTYRHVLGVQRSVLSRAKHIAKESCTHQEEKEVSGN